MGIATGIASLAGMVIALFVLSRNAPVRVMRASLVLFLFISSLMSIVFLLLYGVMTETAAIRGLVLAVPSSIGVFIGSRMFIPRFKPWYRPFSLTLLIGLAAFGLVRTAF
ncbi:MAG: hypothetical protein GKR99_08810 [Rhodobacteraceae bacterium]|nr:hypothetical protein [Paracoccaceae bacterium]